MPAWWRSSCGSPCRDGSVFTKNKNAGLTSSVFSATIHLAFAGVAHLVERDLAKVEVASSSLVARSKKKHHPSGWCFLFGMPRAGLNLLPRPARSALNQEVRQGSCEWLCHSWDAGSESSLVARSKKERHPHGCLSFLEQHFCYAKVVACGRVIEREWGNPQRFPPHTPPSLRYARVRTTKPEGNHKKKHHPSGWCFLFGMSRAGLNLLPRPVRSALNPAL